MPDGAHLPKAISCWASGSLFMSSMWTPEQPCLATFIHSKLLIVEGTKLRQQALPKPRSDNPLFIALFDPSGPLDWALIDDSLEEVFSVDEGIVKKSAQKLGQRLGVVDIE
jgi:hypothetical protein